MAVLKNRWTLPVDWTEDFAKHIFREHNKVADSWANRGRRDGQLCGQKEVRECWDGGAKDSSGCGIVIKAVDTRAGNGWQDRTSVEQMFCDTGRDQRM